MQYLDAVSNDRMISVRFQGKPFNITVIQVYAPASSNAEEAKVEWFYEDLQDLLEFGKDFRRALFLLGSRVCSKFLCSLDFQAHIW